MGNAGDGGPAISALLYYPVGVTVDSAGDAYIADYDNHKIRKVGIQLYLIKTYIDTITYSRICHLLTHIHQCLLILHTYIGNTINRYHNLNSWYWYYR